MTVGQLIKDRALSLRQLQTHPAVQCGIHRIAAASEASRHAAAYRTLLNILPELPAAVADDTDVKLDRIVSIEAPFPLHLIFNINDDGFLIDPRFDPVAIPELQLNQVLDQFEHVLQLLTEAPLKTKLSSLNLLNPHDRQCLSMWNMIVPEKLARPIHEGFRAQVRVRPDTAAVDASDGRVDYRRLDQLSDRLAHELCRRGISRNTAVGLIFERSLWAIVSILAILKAGGTCVPIDRADSHEAKLALCCQVDIKLILASYKEYSQSLELGIDILAVSEGSFSSMPDAAGSDVGNTSYPTDVAYVLFSTGDGGESRGVMLEHRNLFSSLRSQAQKLSWQPGSRMLHLAPYVSSRSVCEVLGTLLSGGCVCIPPDLVNGQSLSGAIQTTQSNWALLPSNELQHISPSSTTILRSILCVGNPLQITTATTWGNSVQLFHGWGACEASFISAMSEVPPGSRDSERIGLPVGCSIWIVNPQNVHHLAPIGSLGELLISGSTVAKGYVGSNPKTGGSFIAPPEWAASFSVGSTNLYRTGELGRFNSDGSISLVGRRSNRLKIRGRTAQLEELEAALRKCHAIRDAAVLTQISAGRTQVVAVVCLSDACLPSMNLLRRLPAAYKQTIDQNVAVAEEYAKSTLFAEVVPSIWIVVERLPLTDSQVLDRTAIRQWLKGFKDLRSSADRVASH
jgi:non-ribosomal peptide synthetase component F